MLMPDACSQPGRMKKPRQCKRLGPLVRAHDESIEHLPVAAHLWAVSAVGGLRGVCAGATARSGQPDFSDCRDRFAARAVFAALASCPADLQLELEPGVVLFTGGPLPVDD